MDSMRNLHSSLPGARRNQPQELLSDFKAAALSVTNLYKAAANAQVQSRAAGYQDALDDLLAYLDRENLGLMDGEGWKVRRWATERLDDGVQRQMSEDDDETGKEDSVETRSSSPEAQRKPAMPVASGDPPQETSIPRRVASEPPQQHQQGPPTSLQSADIVPPQADFTFSTRHAYPTNHDRITSSMELDTIGAPTTPSTPGTAEAVRFVPKTSRNRSNLHSKSRTEPRSTLSLSLGSGAGNKRKTPYQDFFDISGFNTDNQDKRENGRGGKRGRFA